MEIKISFPGGKKVYADVGGMVIQTDQPVRVGGEGSAPSPYLLFLSSIGLCAGAYVMGFCSERGISTEGISIVQKHEYEVSPLGAPKLKKIAVDVSLPPDFPEKYRGAVIKAAEACAVKKTIADPPEIEVRETGG